MAIHRAFPFSSFNQRQRSFDLSFNILVLLIGIISLVMLFACDYAPLLLDDPLVQTEGNTTVFIVESIPDQVDLKTSQTTFWAWQDMIQKAKSTIDIACYYMTLCPETTGDNTEDSQGEQIFTSLKDALGRGVSIRIAINPKGDGMPLSEARELEALGAELYIVDLSAIGGVLHTKFIVVDSAAVYLGSANMDWRALEGVKELGVYIQDSPALGDDLEKVFEQYRLASVDGVPVNGTAWDPSLDTEMSIANTGTLLFNGTSASAYVTEAPPQFLSLHRTWDLTAVNALIGNATSVRLEVMDYGPFVMYSDPQQYFGVVDEALRRSGFEEGDVRIIVSSWNHTDEALWPYVQSLDDAPGVDVGVFEIPALDPGPQVAYTRVSHSKFLVTDTWALITTSNWLGDYWLNTAGCSFVTNHPDIVEALWTVWERDRASVYVSDYSEYVAAPL